MKPKNASVLRTNSSAVYLCLLLALLMRERSRMWHLVRCQSACAVHYTCPKTYFNSIQDLH